MTSPESSFVPNVFGETQSVPSITPKTMDPGFYFESIFVVFKVEDYLFRVPTHRLVNESQFFKDLFDVPQNDENREGDSAEKPIGIEGVKRDDFRSLMKILYPTSVQKTITLSRSEWISVLELSSMWIFINLREIAISSLDSLNSLTTLEKIDLGRRCGVSKWLLAGFEELVSKTETLTDEEVDAVDTVAHRTAIKLFRIREGRLNRIYYYPESQTAEIKRVFADELLSVGKVFE